MIVLVSRKAVKRVVLEAYNRLQCHVAFQELSITISSPLIYVSGIKSDLFLLEPFIPLPFAECLLNTHIPSRIPIVGAIKLGAPDYIYAQISGDTQCREGMSIEQRVNISLMNVKMGRY